MKYYFTKIIQNYFLITLAPVLTSIFIVGFNSLFLGTRHVEQVFLISMIIFQCLWILFLCLIFDNKRRNDILLSIASILFSFVILYFMIK